MNLEILPIPSPPPLTRMNPAINKVLCDSKGKTILIFPFDTLLDNVIMDLWSHVMRYLVLRPYIIGDVRIKYPGYHPVTNEEFNMENFLNYYFENNGIRFKAEYDLYAKQFLLVGTKYLLDDQKQLCDIRAANNPKGKIFSSNRTDNITVDDYDIKDKLYVVLFISDYI